MGMGLFYVTVFGFFFVGGVGGLVLWFTAFLRGVLEKEGVWVWCFDGESVVECVADVVAKQ
jgi:hypothetical protein